MFFCTVRGLFLQPIWNLSTFSSTATMIPCKPSFKKIVFFVFGLLCFFSINGFSQDGKQLFQSNCATCHNPLQDMTGPHLQGVDQRGPWTDRKELYSWIHDPNAYKKKNNPYTQGLDKQFSSNMIPFPALSEKQIDAIVDYVDHFGDEGPPPGEGPNQPATNQNWVIFGVISLIMAVITLILMQVNSNLKKLSDDTEGITRPDPVPFYRNKVYIALLTIILFVVGGYFLTKGAIGLGRQQDYQPEQPIYYSHKVHAGINQISCLYCHGNAWESRHAAIPSVNVCMNCHKTIQEYKGKYKIYNDAGEEVSGSQEIKKLYAYAGFDPANSGAWTPEMIKRPVPWIKIHNLPDHVYFNHSQHIRAGNVQCQTCHGEITEMDQVKQFAELSMGWCINCHRETKVNFNYNDSTGNKFYSLYEKFHEDFKNHKMDSIRVQDIGGLECQRCHY
jgi:cytochrome c551/c552